MISDALNVMVRRIKVDKCRETCHKCLPILLVSDEWLAVNLEGG